MKALITAAEKDPNYPVKFQLVISDQSQAEGLIYAQNAGIKTAQFMRSDFTSKAMHEAAIQEKLNSEDIEFICLAGYMRLLSPQFVDFWQGKIINIHPSLLPLYKGLNTHERALKAGDKEHGCTVHYVTAGMDEGEIITQAKVPVLENDTVETLAERVLEQEHKLYPSTLKQLIERSK